MKIFKAFDNNNRKFLPQYTKEIDVKIILHILIAIFTSCQILIIFSKDSTYQLMMQRVFYNIFLDNSNKNDFDYTRKIFIYNNENFKQFFQEKIENVQNINYLTSFSNIKLKDRGDILSNMKITYLDELNTSRKDKNIHTLDIKKYKTLFKKYEIDDDIKDDFEVKDEYYITKNNLGPLDLSKEKLFYFTNSVKKIENTFRLYSYDNDHTEFKIYWKISQIFDFQTRGHITVYLDINYAYLEYKRSFSSLIDDNLWIHLIVIILAFLNMIILLNSNSTLERHRLWGRGLNNEIGNKNDYRDTDIFNEEEIPLTKRSNSNESNSIYEEFKNYRINCVKEYFENDENIIKNKQNNQDENSNEYFWNILILIGNIFQIIGVFTTFTNLAKFDSYSYGIIAFGK